MATREIHYPLQRRVSMLPDEMETEVLLRLPVKSILRFRAVCRRWAALLSSEEFGAAWTKLAESRTIEPAAQLLFLPLTPPETCKISTEVRCGDGRLLLTIDGVGGPTALALAPCRGLNLLHDTWSGCYHVLNGATQAVARLPPHRQHVPSSAGLGFDPRTKEYKVVRLFFTSDHSTQTSCEVHTLGRGSELLWRQPTSFADTAGVLVPSILLGAALFASMCGRQPVFADGFLHWLMDPTFDELTAGASRPVAAVLSFSLAEETFSSWVRPPPFQWHIHEAHLAVLDGRLCIVRDLRDRSTSSLEIWSYSDGGDAVWSLEHCINLAQHAQKDLLTEPGYVRVVGTSFGKIKVIFVATSKGSVVAYDPTRGTLETILQPNVQRETRPSLARFSIFKESLSPVH